VGDPATKLRNQPLRAGLQPQKREAVENCDAHRTYRLPACPTARSPARTTCSRYSNGVV